MLDAILVSAHAGLQLGPELTDYLRAELDALTAERDEAREDVETGRLLLQSMSGDMDEQSEIAAFQHARAATAEEHVRILREACDMAEDTLSNGDGSEQAVRAALDACTNTLAATEETK